MVFLVSSRKTLRQKLHVAIRGERRHNKKKKRRLSRHERAIRKRAAQFAKAGNVTTAAQLLESINLPREAIELLERHGQVQDAAKILMRMGLQDRAGALYARNRLWHEAAQCYDFAGMELEATKCLRAAGEIQEAARRFEKQGHLKDAADCRFEMGNYAQAARLYVQADKLEQAIIAFKTIAQSEDARFELNQIEIDVIKDYIRSGNIDPGLANALSTHGQLTDLILELVDKDDLLNATDLYRCDPGNPAPALVSQVHYHTDQAKRLVTLLRAVEDYKHSGIVLERLEQYEEAANDFEKAKEWVRASDCYHRSGNMKKVQELSKHVARVQADGPGDDSKFCLDDASRVQPFSGAGQVQFADAPKVKQDQPEVEPDPPAPATPSFSLSAVDVDPPTTVTPSPSSVPSEEKSQSPVPAHGDALDLGSLSLDLDGEEETVVDHMDSPMKEPGDLEDTFGRIDLFSTLDSQQLSIFERSGVAHRFEDGQLVLEDSKPDGGMHVLLSGSLQVDDGDVRIRAPAVINPASCLIGRESGQAFTATEPVRVHVIAQEKLENLLQNHGKICWLLYKRFTVVFTSNL